MTSVTHSLVSDSLQTPWTVAGQASLSMDFSRQEYWSGLPFPSPADHPILRIKPRSLTSQADSLLLSHQGSPIYYEHSRTYVNITQSRPLSFKAFISRFQPFKDGSERPVQVGLHLLRLTFELGTL